MTYTILAMISAMFWPPSGKKIPGDGAGRYRVHVSYTKLAMESYRPRKTGALKAMLERFLQLHERFEIAVFLTLSSMVVSSSLRIAFLYSSILAPRLN